MKKKMLAFVSSAMMLLLLGGCGATGAGTSSSAVASNASSVSDEQAGNLSITHSLGDIAVGTNPSKVVVFDYGILDTMDALGVEAEIALPKDNLPAYLEKYNGEAYTSVGGVKEFDLEAVSAFQPELIIISTRQQDYYQDLSEIAPTLYVELDSTKYMEDFESNVRLIAQIFNKTEQAEKDLLEIEAQVEQVKLLAKEKNEKALIILTNDGSISAYGAGSRFGIIHDILGIPMADEGIEVSTHGQEINYEYIAEKNPDILFVVDRTIVVGGDNTASKTLDNALVNGTNAAMNERIVMLDPDVWYLSGGGLISVEKMVQDIHQVLEG